MSHFSVLIIGPDPEWQLEPFAELSALDGPLAEDYRAVFEVEVFKADFAAIGQEIVTRAEYERQGDLPHLRELLAAEDYQEIFARWFGGELGPEGDWGFWSNPDAKWDWFMLGGRWQGRLRLFPGRSGTSGECSWTNDGAPEDPNAFDQARADVIDWPATRQDFTPFAVLKDGEWYEQGDSGWFDSPTADPAADAAWEAGVDALLKELPPETLVSVYDCHI
jgi:hypothetical protein